MVILLNKLVHVLQGDTMCANQILDAYQNLEAKVREAKCFITSSLFKL
jgi:hypothetical protein